MIVRIAAAMARARHPEYRWRQITVVISAFLFMLLILSAASVVSLMMRQEERDARRTAIISAVPMPTDLIIVPRDDEWAGEQFAVVWIEPAGDASSVLPPGMVRMPAPGQAVVSPALDRLAAQTPALAGRYPNRLVLGSEGVRDGDELFAYIRVPPDRSIASDWRAIRVERFGQPGPDEPSFPVGFASPVDLVVVGEGLLIFLVVPGLLLLIVGVASASRRREHRFLVLHWLGASPRTLIRLGVIETLMLATPGLILAALVLGFAGMRLEQVPFIDHTVIRGDLGIAWWALLVIIVASLVITATVVMATGMVHVHSRSKGPRPSIARQIMSPLRAAPLGFALVSWAVWRIVGGTFGATLFYAGIVIATASLPLLTPALVRPAGETLARLGSVPALIAGRGLAWDPLRRARPFAGVAALITLALASTGYFAYLRNVPPSPSSGNFALVTVSWLDPNRSDLDRLADTVGTGLVASVSATDSGIAIGATCAQLARFVDGSSCDPGFPYRLSDEAAQALARYVSQPVQLVPVHEIEPSGRAVVIDTLPVSDLHARTRSAAMAVLPAPTVSSIMTQIARPSALVDWLAGGIVIALGVLFLSCLLAIIDRILATNNDRRLLVRIGMVPRQLAIVEAWQFAAPYVLVCGVGGIIGAVICAQIIVASGIPVPWRPIASIVGIASAAGIIGTLGHVAFGMRAGADVRAR